jgi:hypothetical protein
VMIRVYHHLFNDLTNYNLYEYMVVCHPVINYAYHSLGLFISYPGGRYVILSS